MRDLIGAVWRCQDGVAIVQEWKSPGRYLVRVINSKDFIMDTETIERMLKESPPLLAGEGKGNQ